MKTEKRIVPPPLPPPEGIGWFSRFSGLEIMAVGRLNARRQNDEMQQQGRFALATLATFRSFEGEKADREIQLIHIVNESSVGIDDNDDNSDISCVRRGGSRSGKGLADDCFDL